MSMGAKNLANEPFKAVTSDGVAIRFRRGDPKPCKLTGGRVDDESFPVETGSFLLVFTPLADAKFFWKYV